MAGIDRAVHETNRLEQCQPVLTVGFEESTITQTTFWDDFTSRTLDREMVTLARAEEIAYVRDTKLFEKVPI